ncbi:hypothetical protein KAFR_0A04940 [Kazachstania africana CBS 2517]|uniref:Zn(2)-C6 fungal-type domain-containing protein n=1 Tax=Kazachstania africana (strain ATCC 22294 / BCRC 22015 / CBS 2517 / CECT 1963 / NBRC 1671 / NRRL Y-8276) TaxID=1071382 RepID=H2ANI0_KAZAF|nr:hypothetical protein KAFR_0A04940 [Kazachstania africana CBS 2517]CCF55930.1 hypothetical protein KAFR_0A04940 [Kazachstania africana CBS 2517]
MGRPKKKVSEQNIENFQRELELAGDRVDILLNDKKGRSRSCLLCRRRKQKCDHKLPSCTACLKAAVKCVQPARYAEQSNEHDLITDTSPNTFSTSTTALSTLLENSTPNTYNDPGHSLITSGYTPTTVKVEDSQHIIAESPMTAINALISNGSHSLSTSASSISIPSNGKESVSQMVSPVTTNPLVTNKRNSKNYVTDPTKKKRKSNDKDQYTSFIERKLKYLEKLIDLPIGGTVFNKKLSHYKKITHLLGEIDDLENISLPATFNKDNPNIDLQQQQYHLPQLSANDNQKSVLSLHSNSSQYQHEKVNDSLKTLHLSHQNTIPALSSDSLESIDFSKCIFSKYITKDVFTYDPAFEFDEQLSRSLLEIFFSRLQFKYPLLDEGEIYTFHDNYSKNNIYSYSANDFHFATGRMWLVFSIGAHLHMTSGKYKGLPPDRYFSTAVRHVTKCGEELNDVQKIELLTLLAMYLLRTDRDSMILYEIIKDVMFICKEKLHLNRWYPNNSFANKKLRIFWCVYLLERMICVAVGKPFVIKENEISLPLFDENSFNTQNSKINGVHFINQSLKLRKIESSFVEVLKILPANQQSTTIKKAQLPMVRKYFHDLDIWRASCVTTSVRSFENETLKLYYYRAVRLLLQPYLEFLTPEDQLFKECQAAAGQICQLYKIFHQKTATGNSTPAVHTVFASGVTLIYCMWLSRNFDDEKRKVLGDSSKHTRPLISASLFSTMDDLRACSVSLYVMAERSKFARVFRDTFDQLMNATIGNLIERCGPDSSELIYLSATPSDDELEQIGKQFDSGEKEKVFIGINGMPPAIKRTFGKKQAEEHAAFVENPRADDNQERKEFKERQGFLKKATVPTGLANLLTKSDESSSSDEENESKVPSTSQDNAQQSGTDEIMDKLSVNSDIAEHKKNKYVVKKPANHHNSDWQLYQQQAFFQQHFAQQNLQAYLSSLNYMNRANPVGTSSQNVIDSNQFRMPLQNAIDSSQSRYPLEDLTSSRAISSPAMNDNPAPTTDSTSVRSSVNMTPINNTNNLRSASQTVTYDFNSLQGKNTAQSGILISSGTNDMINNISTWTNNSVTDAVGMIEQQEGQAFTIQPGGTPGESQLLNNTSQLPNYPNFVNSTAGTGEDTPAKFNSYMSGIGGSIQGNFNRDRNGSTATWDNTIPSAQSEEFWTVNDDYGFLT